MQTRPAKASGQGSLSASPQTRLRSGRRCSSPRGAGEVLGGAVTPIIKGGRQMFRRRPPESLMTALSVRARAVGLVVIALTGMAVRMEMTRVAGLVRSTERIRWPDCNQGDGARQSGHLADAVLHLLHLQCARRRLKGPLEWTAQRTTPPRWNLSITTAWGLECQPEPFRSSSSRSEVAMSRADMERWLVSRARPPRGTMAAAAGGGASAPPRPPAPGSGSRRRARDLFQCSARAVCTDILYRVGRFRGGRN